MQSFFKRSAHCCFLATSFKVFSCKTFNLFVEAGLWANVFAVAFYLSEKIVF